MLLGWSVRCPRGVVPSGDTQGPMHVLPMLWEIYLLLLWSQGPPQAGSPGALCSSTAQKDVAFGLMQGEVKRAGLGNGEQGCIHAGRDVYENRFLIISLSLLFSTRSS